MKSGDHRSHQVLGRRFGTVVVRIRKQESFQVAIERRYRLDQRLVLSELEELFCGCLSSPARKSLGYFKTIEPLWYRHSFDRYFAAVNFVERFERRDRRLKNVVTRFESPARAGESQVELQCRGMTNYSRFTQTVDYRIHANALIDDDDPAGGWMFDRSTCRRSDPEPTGCNCRYHGRDRKAKSSSVAFQGDKRDRTTPGLGGMANPIGQIQGFYFLFSR